MEFHGFQRHFITRILKKDRQLSIDEEEGFWDLIESHPQYRHLRSTVEPSPFLFRQILSLHFFVPILIGVQMHHRNSFFQFQAFDQPFPKRRFEGSLLILLLVSRFHEHLDRFLITKDSEYFKKHSII
jgi:hypothetical protein